MPGWPGIEKGHIPSNFISKSSSCFQIRRGRARIGNQMPRGPGTSYEQINAGVPERWSGKELNETLLAKYLLLIGILEQK